MRINCPWCGPRPLGEFTYGGDAAISRPENPEKTDLAAFVDYVYLRDNPAGPHKEYWYHHSGCRSWLEVGRDTATHEIHNVDLAAPDPDGEPS